MKKLKTFGSSYFIAKSYFEEDDTQIFLVSQPMHKYFKHIVDSNYILEWRSKVISDKNITPPSASYNFLTPSLNYLGTKRKVRFIGSCLKQEKIRYSQGKTVNIYIVYEINRNENTTSSDPTLENCVFGTFSLNKNADID